MELPKLNQFKYALRAATAKLGRCENGYDPQSGFQKNEIVDYIKSLADPSQLNEVQIVNAVLRRNQHTGE